MNTKLEITPFGGGQKVELTNYPVFIKKGVKVGWVLFCPAFNVVGSSVESEEAAEKNLKATIDIFFHHHLTHNTLESALNDLGWTGNSYTSTIGVPPAYTQNLSCVA
jgi:predicted RNase H-like HicB family nuclease